MKNLKRRNDRKEFLKKKLLETRFILMPNSSVGACLYTCPYGNPEPFVFFVICFKRNCFKIVHLITISC